MESNEEKYEYIVELSRNISQPNIDNEWDNVNNNNIEEIEEIEKENIRGRKRGRERGRGRGRDKGKGRGSSGDNGREIGHDNEEKQIIQLPAPSFFNILHHFKPLHKFMVNLPHNYQFNFPTPYSIFSFFFSLE
ncbi:unnamed protein product [Rhizophagus irregularis]|nr:unnamed protein product [Rhizophagus irregularis]CAB5387706.1 unnamed protein product [Rhizophagus irregularis]